MRYSILFVELFIITIEISLFSDLSQSRNPLIFGIPGCIVHSNPANPCILGIIWNIPHSTIEFTIDTKYSFVRINVSIN